MKNIRKIAIIILFLNFVMACNSFTELEKNPNIATNVPASLIFKGLLVDIYQAPWNDVQRWNQFWCSNYNYYDTQEYNWFSTDWDSGTYGSFLSLNNVNKMEEAAKNAGGKTVNPYSALAKFFKAYYFTNLTLRVGDVPLTESLTGKENLTPKYDTQKSVFVQVLKWLDEANDDMAVAITNNDATLAGDIYLNNDLKAWQKVINAFKLRVLLHLSKKDTDTDLNVKARFAAILANPTKYPLMVSMNDNLQFYYNSTVNFYPFNPGEYGKIATRDNMAQTHIKALTDIQDPRVFMVAEPAKKKLDAGLLPTNFNAFVGAGSGESLDDMSTKALAGEYSFINRKRYFTTYTAEPCIQIGYIEQCFNIAEGINRGWAGGNAETYYQNGIQASQAFFGVQNGTLTLNFLKEGGLITNSGDFISYTYNFDYNAYYNQTAVKYAGNNTTGLNQILLQKYLGFFNNSGWEAFYNQRRTGIPTFLVGVGTGRGATSEANAKIPKRWQYPINEKNFNATNVNAAITSQYAGTDNLDALMWILQ